MDNTMLGVALRTACGPLTDLLKKLGGEDGEVWLAALNRFLRKENPWTVVFAVLKTITLGLHKSVPAYIAALESAGLHVGEIARLMCEKVTVSTEQVTYELYVTTTAELGFPKGATFAQICARIKDLGYQLCPAEVGLALRLAYQDQPLNEWLRIVMEPISDSDGNPGVFSVGRDEDGQWLSGSWIDPGRVWGPDGRWVFCRPVPVASK